MRTDRYNYHSFQGMPNVPYKSQKQTKTSIRELTLQVVSALIVGFLLTGAVALVLVK